MKVATALRSVYVVCIVLKNIEGCEILCVCVCT